MMDGRTKWLRSRIICLGVFFVVVFVAVAVRAFHLQVLCRDEWVARAERQRQRVVPLAPQRGTIFDSNGEELAVSTEVDSIYIDPKKVSGSGNVAKDLANILTIPVSSVKAKLRSEKSFIWLKRQVSPQESEEVRALGLQGVQFVKEHRRYYPNSEIGAHVIGFTGLDPEGLEGIELEFDATLLGRGGFLVTEKDALGRPLGDGDGLVREGVRGNDIYLTLDKNLQYVAEKELAAGIAEVKGRGGTVIVMEPWSGRILAMANAPQYNPNAIQNYKPSQWRNRAVCDMYEPGSTLKLFLMAAALEEGVVGTGQKIDCEKGSYKVGGKVVHDHYPYQKLTVAEILKFSSNIGSVKVGSLLGRERYYEYLTSFGFGEQTQVDVPGEAAGLLKNPSQWFDMDLAAISFGQGISVTPIQLVSATSAIANGGLLMSPYVVERIVDENGDVVNERRPRIIQRVISKETARKVREMMVMTTETGGTATLAAVPGYKVGGKTGTAQKVDPVTGGYSADKRVASFVGFAPAENPRLVILVVVDEPEERSYGGLVAAPIFSRIAAQSLNYYKIRPQGPEEKGMLNRFADTAPARFLRIEETPSKGSSNRSMPDCLGMSSRQVLQVMDRTGLNIRIRGSGRVIEQSPPPGNQIIYGNEVWVRLGPPA